ncbi:MAG: DUF6090 family protein [Bacteroidota bacterium]
MAKQNTFFSNIGKYLIEIVIIIIGISLSFALNDWEKKESAQVDYQDYLQKLQQDIRIDSIQIWNDMRSYKNKIKGVDLIFKYHRGFGRDSIALLGQAQNALSNFIEFLPNDKTFQVLTSTGDFKVFTNDSLVSELFQLYGYDYAFIEMLGREANDKRANYLKPYLIENIYFEDKITFPHVRTDIGKVVSDRTFRNICLDYKESSQGAYLAYQRALERLVRINELISGELIETE